MLTMYSQNPSTELEIQVLASFTYLEHKMRLTRKEGNVRSAMQQYGAQTAGVPGMEGNLGLIM